jgi:hypothetical protein
VLSTAKRACLYWFFSLIDRLSLMRPDFRRLPKTRAEARLLGMDRFFTGKPCRYGHIAPGQRTRMGGDLSLFTLCIVKRRLERAMPREDRRRALVRVSAGFADASTRNAHADTFVGGAGINTVYGTAATLSAGDSLTGGAGSNVLQLIGSGSFDVSQLASFSGVWSINLDNPTNSFASLVLGGQPIEVDATGYLSIPVASPSNWNGSDVIHGDTSYPFPTTTLYFNNPDPYPQQPLTYDLTSDTFSNVSIGGGSNNLTLLINNADTAGIQSFYGGLNDELLTAGSTLDLSHTAVSGFTVVSRNPFGTIFTVGDLGTFRSPACLAKTPSKPAHSPSPLISATPSSPPAPSRPSSIPAAATPRRHSRRAFSR